MKQVYIAGKYTGVDYLEVDRNIAAAREAAAFLARNRIAYHCPHMNSAHFEVITPEVPPEFWYEMTLEAMRRCDALLVLPSWSQSKGTQGELAEAHKLGLPVFYYFDDDSELADGEVMQLRNWYFGTAEVA